MAERVQLRREKGWRLPPGMIRVCRPTKWGNPFVAHDWRAAFRALALGERGDRAGRNAAAVKLYRLWLTAEFRPVSKRRAARRDFWEKEVLTLKPGRLPPTLAEIRAELRGKNLACWCPLDAPCHADVLLELANS
jgi:hypothetical protein